MVKKVLMGKIMTRCQNRDIVSETQCRHLTEEAIKSNLIIKLIDLLERSATN